MKRNGELVSHHWPAQPIGSPHLDSIISQLTLSKLPSVLKPDEQRRVPNRSQHTPVRLNTPKPSPVTQEAANILSKQKAHIPFTSNKLYPETQLPVVCVSFPA